MPPSSHQPYTTSSFFVLLVLPSSLLLLFSIPFRTPQNGAFCNLICFLPFFAQQIHLKDVQENVWAGFYVYINLNCVVLRYVVFRFKGSNINSKCFVSFQNKHKKDSVKTYKSSLTFYSRERTDVCRRARIDQPPSQPNRPETISNSIHSFRIRIHNLFLFYRVRVVNVCVST